jgi:snurportin-1
MRTIPVDIPILLPNPPLEDGSGNGNRMQVESATPSFRAKGCIESVTTNVQPDGLLLYVSEASYEPGTSPLSSWIPITGYEKPDEPIGIHPLELFHR